MPLKITKNTIPAAMKAAGVEIDKRVERALRLIMEVKRTEVVKRTPKDTGALRSTIHVEGPERSGRKVTCSIVAGGPAAMYAIVQHEDLTLKHTIGQAKYIESVILESARTMSRDIAALVKF